MVYRVHETEDGNACRTVERLQVPRDLVRRNRTRRALRRALIEEGYLPSPGCDCAHCANGWDCCGRMVPQRVAVTAVCRRTLTAVVRVDYVRNV